MIEELLSRSLRLLLGEAISPQPALMVPFGASLLSRLPITHHKQASAVGGEVRETLITPHSS